MKQKIKIKTMDRPSFFSLILVRTFNKYLNLIINFFFLQKKCVLLRKSEVLVLLIFQIFKSFLSYF